MRKLKPVKPDSSYRRVWRIVDGVIRDCIAMHPDYIAPKDIRRVRESIAKRVTGAVLAYQAEAEKAKGPIREKRGL